MLKDLVWNRSETKLILRSRGSSLIWSLDTVSIDLLVPMFQGSTLKNVVILCVGSGLMGWVAEEYAL